MEILLAIIVVLSIHISMIKVDGTISRALDSQHENHGHDTHAHTSAHLRHHHKNRSRSSEKWCSPAAFLPPFRRREDIGHSLRAFNLTIGAELGVQRGGFLKDLLRTWQTAEVYVLVDLWQHQSSDLNYVDDANVEQARQDLYKAEAINATLEVIRIKFLTSFEVCQNFTTVCSQRYPDDHFDFIYVDARHDYKGVLQDLTHWWPKLRKGGIMAGDDYVTVADLGRSPSSSDWSINYDGTRDAAGRAVRGAVDEFFSDATGAMAGCPRQVTTLTTLTALTTLSSLTPLITLTTLSNSVHSLH